MRNSLIIFAVILSLLETGCASNQSVPGQESRGDGATDIRQENSLGARASRISMQIGPPECNVR